MGKGQSKEKQKLLDNLTCKDWKAVEKENQDAVEPLCYWIKTYNYNGKLSTSALTELQNKIKIKCKNNEKQMRKEGYAQTQVWVKIAKQREEGERLAKQEREERKRQNKEKKKASEEEQKREKEESKWKEAGHENIMFHRREDNEYSGPYLALQQQLLQQQGGAVGRNDIDAPTAPPPPSPPGYTPRTPIATRSTGAVGKRSATLGHLLSPLPRVSPMTLDEGGDVQTFPLIELPNPRAGAEGQSDTIRVYRTWTQDDVKKAVEGIPHPREDVDESVRQMEDLRKAYHLNGIEVQQAWMCKLGPDWYHVKGGYNPSTAVGVPLAADSAELTTQLVPLLERIKGKYKKRANYTEIGRCKQKPDEPFDEYRVRMAKVFKVHSGLEPSEDENGAYQQQLKNALHSGSTPDIHGWVNRHYIGMSGGSLADYINHALHAEKVIKSKKGKKDTVRDVLSTVTGQGKRQRPR
ncbi:uncharacterized protein LOC124883664 [Girardinichthys multiradiatus]|uniref:uncharacterized protein LOC124883664 n=1 Tax=Girardinichthys multiradiatus TaxID=208333 RepID=UPI001FAC7699|nr:uncharacterized protein LOC124883664 [Girardinichthys multiradiatus]